VSAHDKETTDKVVILEHAVKRFLPGFYELWRGGPDVVLFEYCRITRTGGLWLVVVRALDVSLMRHVVVFGSGEHLWDALRNASLAAGKRKWRPDKYAK